MCSVRVRVAGGDQIYIKARERRIISVPLHAIANSGPALRHPIQVPRKPTDALGILTAKLH